MKLRIWGWFTSQYWSVEVIEYEAMIGFWEEKDLEEMMLRGTREFIKFWDNVEGIIQLRLVAGGYINT